MPSDVTGDQRSTEAPINNIPHEILQEIFTHIHPYFTPSSKPIRMEGPNVWVLRLVSKSWSTLVMCTPELWTRFLIYQPTDASIETLRSALRRSANRALEVVINERKYSNDFTESSISVIPEVFDLFYREITRCKRFECHIQVSDPRNNEILTKLLDLDSSQLENLKEASFNVVGWDLVHAQRLYEKLRILPNISRLGWYGRLAPTTTLSGNRLTEINLGQPTPVDDVHCCLQLTTNIVDFRIGGLHPTDDTWDVLQVTLPYLHTLQLGICHGDSVSSLLNRLILPAIKNLSFLETEVTDSEIALKELLAQCQLENLDIAFTSDMFTEQHLLKRLDVQPSTSSLQSLKTLKLYLPSYWHYESNKRFRRNKFTRAIFDFLTNAHGLVPNLSSLELGDINGQEVLAAVCEMVQCFVGVNVPISELTLTLEDEEDNVDQENLNAQFHKELNSKGVPGTHHPTFSVRRHILW
ncbi:hypothetical protein BDN72DRAFT_898449 [Pluteus cervinus]|uniref:Uncharacterized protein n=1 Tax=Pluteus cervinus TaxID=181527 RepID=A0ACD3AR45_9AGAR|nr:hypothetical protein BDN72DRAFT_898449 [Pluteus cervinus]